MWSTFFRTSQVYDSRIALASCMQHAPDLVLVDFNMPHYDGLAVVEQLQQLPVPCRVVVISMYAEKGEIARFGALNVAGYIAKTVAADRLLSLLRQVMQGQRVVETDIEPVVNLQPANPVGAQYGLTKREVEILRRVRQGLTTEEIANALSLSYYTVQTHRKNISQKLPFDTKKDFYAFLETLG